MKAVSIFFFLIPIYVQSGILDWFWGEPKAIEFDCPFGCGKWGSSRIREIENLISLAILWINRTDEFYYQRISSSYYMPYYANENFFDGWVSHPPIGLMRLPACFPDHCFGWRTKKHYEEITTSEGLVTEEFKGVIFERRTDSQCPDHCNCLDTTKSKYVCFEISRDGSYKENNSSLVDIVRASYRLDNYPDLFEIIEQLKRDASCCSVKVLNVEKELLIELQELPEKIQKLQKYIETLEANPDQIRHFVTFTGNPDTNLERAIDRKAYRETCLKKAQEKYQESFLEKVSTLVNDAYPIMDREKETYFLPLLEEARTYFKQIHETCQQQHKAPASFYNQAICFFLEGDQLRAIECIEKLFNRIDLENIENHLASDICLYKGSAEREVALFDEAIKSLNLAIQRDPRNKNALLERALTYLEQGNFEQALTDYLGTEVEVKSLGDTVTHYFDFSVGLISGIREGGIESVADFVPSMFSSLKGIGHGLWAFALDPQDVSVQMYSTCKEMVTFLRENSTLKIAQALIPEVRELVENTERLSKRREGELIGHIIGKYGTDFFAIAGMSKGVKAYRSLKKANEILTLEALKDLRKAETLTEISQAWWRKTAPVIEEIKSSNGVRFDQQLAKAFKKEYLSELQVRQILHHSGFKTFPKPKGIPCEWKVQLSKENGGMRYRLDVPGKNSTLNVKVDVRVMPGDLKSPNPSQRHPYVVHNVNGQYLNKNGKVVGGNHPEAHIPYSEYDFEKLSKMAPYE